MRYGRAASCIALLLLMLVAGGCTPYAVLTPLEKPMETPSKLTMGAITDRLPLDMEDQDKPTMEEIQKFKDLLFNELSKKEFIEMLEHNSPDARYEVNGEVIEYKRGSGALRFLVGFGAGNARILTTMSLIDKTSDEKVFSASFKAEIGDWMTKGDEMYNKIAKNFAKAVEKEQKKALKNNKSD